jgi:hypothetical protein
VYELSYLDANKYFDFFLEIFMAITGPKNSKNTDIYRIIDKYALDEVRSNIFFVPKFLVENSANLS